MMHFVLKLLFFVIRSAQDIPILNMLTLDKVDNFGYTVLTVTNMSLDKVDKLYGDVFKINYTFKYAGERCTPKGKMTTIAEIKYSIGIDVFIGPVCGSDLEIAACMASSWNIPIISPSGSSDLVTNKTEFSTLTNMAFTMEKFALFYVRIFNFYRWQDIVLIYEEKQPLLKLLAKSLYDVFRRANITTTTLPFQERNFKPLLQEGSKHSRVFATISTDDDFRNLILTAQSLGMTNEEYAHLFIRFYEVEHTGLRSWERNDEFDEVARSAYDSVLVLQPSRPESKQFTQFVKDVKVKAFNEFNYTMHNEEVNIFTTAFYDSISVYAQIINESLTDGEDIRDGQNISRRMKNRVFHGISGKISIDKNGDREPDFQLLDMDMDSGDFVIVAEYFGSTGTMTFRNYTSIHWPSDRGPPKNIPDCGFKGDNPYCKEKGFNSTGLIAGLLVVVFLVVVVAGLVMNRRLKKEAELKSQWWNIRTEDLIFRSQVVGSRHSKFSMLMSTDELRSLQYEITSTTTDFTSHNKKHAIYKGTLVAVMKTNCLRMVINRQFLIELKTMKDLQCNNLVKFFGLYRTLKGVFIVMEDCSRGSLQDILQNDSLSLDWDFKAALVTDLANGMSYLHDSPILIHGRLNSDRCIIDSRFVLKISEFGLPSILGSNHLKCVENEKECIWFAPECLRGDKVSQSSDVYSFAMIMFEILTRMSPFEEEVEKASIHDVIRKIKTKGNKPFRPSLPAMSDDVPKMIDLMQLCWDESLFKRPTFRSIKKQLKEITGISASHNILDALLRRMEQYANNLEELVGQRTEAFLEEKKKSDQLLEQLLPKTVADKLKNNQIVDPEAYDSVTIYFSDIVGFTVLSAESSPMEVVDLLNDLYCVFDAIIERYDVYKVETIGDAYMVVSGLPTRNGDDHVRQIAKMSLEIVQNVGIFKIRHLPEKHLQARIGIHSGPVCAGVVGTKMPRFCLFGDTVNTASRMESHGEAMKIHVSPDTKSLLDKHDGFLLEPRGNIEIKGKGLMKTHWLIREIRNSKVIPNHDLSKYDPKIIITDDDSLEMQPQFFNIATTSKPLEEDQRSIFNGII